MKINVIGVFLWIGLFISSPYLCMTSSDGINKLRENILLEYRALHPGEIIEVNVKEIPGIKSALVLFRDKHYPLIQLIENKEFIGFLGIDMEAESGIYPLWIDISFRDGSNKRIFKEIFIKPKRFPSRRLWVDEKYVTPPPETHFRIKKEAALLRDIFSEVSQQWFGQGAFIIPSSGKVILNFGEKRILNGKPCSSHSGIDIQAKSGTPVHASNSGKTVLAQDLYFCGKTVILDHGMGVFSYYCHLLKLKVVKGNIVNKGDYIGQVGATGRVTGPHLHWAVKIRGDRVDPLSLLYFDL